MRGGDKQQRGLLVVAACAVAWVLIVAVSAGRAPSQTPLLGLHDFGAVLDVVVALVLLALLGLVAVLIFSDRDAEFEPPEKRKRSLVLLVVVVALLIANSQLDLVAPLTEVVEEASQRTDSEPELEEPKPVPANETVAQLSDIVLVLAALAVLVGFVLVVRYRLASTTEVAERDDLDPFEADMLVAIDNAAQLLDGVDPRSAVLNAYASLEQVLAERGLDRTPAETPTEHLRRSTQSLRVDPDALVVLARLYERARFSDDVISVDDQRSAQAALVQARNDVMTRS